MSTTDDGGAAFPVLGNSGQSLYNQAPGMTLRDWFAGQAIAGLVPLGFDVTEPLNNPVHNDPELIAKNAYILADAMLAARKVQS